VQSGRALLHGVPLQPEPSLGTLVLGGSNVRLLSASGLFLAALGWPDGVLGPSRSGSLGHDPTVRQIAAVPGGVVALLAGTAGSGVPAAGDVFFVPVNSQDVAMPRLIARASYLAAAPDGHGIWLEQPSASPGRGLDRAWLVSESGRQLSPVVWLHHQVLLAATVRGLLTQGPARHGANLINPTTGASRPLRVPASALIDAVGADDVAWQPGSCRSPCPLHVTSLRTGTDTVIALPPRTTPYGSPSSAAFAGNSKRLALPMEIADRAGRTTGTRVYVANIDDRRLLRLPGGPVPLSAGTADIGAVPARGPDLVSVRWAGARLWIVASDGSSFQAAYWAGGGPLRVLTPLAGAGDIFDVVTASAGAMSVASPGGTSRQRS
jgi:hypothetical protein